MKKVLLLLLIIPTLSFGFQEDHTVDAKKEFKKEIAKVNFGKLELLEFKQTSITTKKHRSGLKIHMVEFEAQLKAVTDINFFEKKIAKWKGFFPDYDINDVLKNRQINIKTNTHLVKFNAGETFKVTGVIRVIK